MFGIGLYSPINEANIGGALRALQFFNGKYANIFNSQAVKHAADTGKSYLNLPVFRPKDIFNVPYANTPVAIEITENSISLPDFQHPRGAYYIFGPENGSLPQDIIERCAYTVSIPTTHCLNLAGAVNVVCYDRIAKLGLENA